MARCTIDDRGRECSKCKEYKLYEHYVKNKRTSWGYSSECKDCIRLYNKKRWKEDRATLESQFKRSLDKQPGGVYRIKTTIGDYIGESRFMKHRVVRHKCPSVDTPVTKDNFIEWEVLEYIDSEVLRKEREAYWIDKLKPKLNKRLVKERV